MLQGRIAPKTAPGTGPQAASGTAVLLKHGTARGQFALDITRAGMPSEGPGQSQKSPHQGGHTGPGTGHGRASEEET